MTLPKKEEQALLLTDLDFNKINETVYLYGQQDYVARMGVYIATVFPMLNVKKIKFGLENEGTSKELFILQSKDHLLPPASQKPLLIVCFFAFFRSQAEEHLRSLGYCRFFFYDSQMDNLLKRCYLDKVYEGEGKQFLLLEEMTDEHEADAKETQVYMALCEVDKSLSREPSPSQYIIPIQVGAALTDRRMAQVTDDTGDNISIRNRHYSEMTAFYWLWKNAKADYLGLCHYRRWFKNINTIARKLQTVDIDAVLPLPTYYEKPLNEGYLRRYLPAVTTLFWNVLQDMAPDYFADAKKILGGHWQYGNNMCILSRHTLDAYAGWLFPIVMEIEHRADGIADESKKRFAGYCTECLLTIYFLSNKQKWRIAHAEKEFLE